MRKAILNADERLDAINDSVTLIQKKNGPTFGTDAYLLSAFCRPCKTGFAAELGCGTGVISLLLAARGVYPRIAAAEIQPALADLARRNAELNNLSARVNVLCADVRELTPKAIGGTADAVFANPPYMRADSGFASPHAEKQIARHEVCGDLFDFAAAAARLVRWGGAFYTVWRPDRLQTLFAALEKNGFAPKRMLFVRDRADKAPAMVLTEARRGAAEGLTVLPTLILRGADGSQTPEAARVYETGRI